MEHGAAGVGTRGSQAPAWGVEDFPGGGRCRSVRGWVVSQDSYIEVPTHPVPPKVTLLGARVILMSLVKLEEVRRMGPDPG